MKGQLWPTSSDLARLAGMQSKGEGHFSKLITLNEYVLIS